MHKPDLINTLKSLDALSQDQKAYLIDLVNTKKKYGLVWEDKPEDVEELLRQNLPVLTEVAERRILATPGGTAIRGKENGERVQEDKSAKADQATLDFAPATNRFNSSTLLQGTTIESVEGISDPSKKTDNHNPNALPFSSEEKGPGDEVPNHLLIEGDNLHALTALTFTHEGRVDVIYIDPPYNTGNKDFKYNDRFVDREDAYRHSKWLSFMHKRLLIAKRLLADTGVIFISIDENEAQNLRLLLDEIFGEENFIEQLVWNKRIPKNDKGIGNIHEFVFLFAKRYNSEHLFTQKKEGIEDVNTFVKNLENKKIPIPDAEKEVKRFFKKNAYDRGITLYNSLNDNYQLWGKINVSWPNAKTTGPRYDVLHPKNKKPCKVPDKGWRFTRETFDALLDYQNIIEHHDGSFICGNVWFAKDENTQPSTIKYLHEVNEFLLRSILSTKSDGNNELVEIIGSGKFDYPKPTDLINRLLGSVNNENALILDFFAGSGTTLHATMQLNAEDGGTRQCILVTNNENSIAEEVCYERNKRVIQGYTNAKGQQVPGLTNNSLRYYRCETVPRQTTLPAKRLLMQRATELLCIKEGLYDEVPTLSMGEQIRGYGGGPASGRNQRYLLIIYDDLCIDEAVTLIRQTVEAEPDARFRVYVFSNGQYPYTEEFEEVLPYVTLCALPDALYKAYRQVLPAEQAPVRLADEEAAEDSPLTLF